MQTCIQLVPQALTDSLLNDLESRELITTLRPTQRLASDLSCDAVDPQYITDKASGSYQMLVVRKNQTQIRLTTHTDHETVIFMDRQSAQFKPLFLIIALHSKKKYLELGHAGQLTAKDVLALEIPFNDPALSIFTVMKDTVHCEVTVPGLGEAPLFYVAEPDTMRMDYIDIPGLTFQI